MREGGEREGERERGDAAGVFKAITSSCPSDMKIVLVRVGMEGL